ncbi:MAG: host-nuclease inhibitor Gam family protein [Bacteroidales bacterium]|nr:host-nuclease inhibitor Gam family protein [Bacteroidales bacterium]
MNKYEYASEEMEVQDEQFVIDTDLACEWALKKLAEARKEAKRYIQTCDDMILEYTRKIEKKESQLETSSFILISKLQNYFDGVEHKETKTQETYTLPSGKLKKKYATPIYNRDETALLKWVKDNKPEAIETTESVKWEDVKKDLQIDGEKAITKDGEIVDGINVTYNQEKFIVETED